MKFYIKPETFREMKVWDSGWRYGLALGLIICLIEVILIAIIK